MKGLTFNNNRFSKRNTYSEATHPEEVEPLFEEGKFCCYSRSLTTSSRSFVCKFGRCLPRLVQP